MNLTLKICFRFYITVENYTGFILWICRYITQRRLNAGANDANERRFVVIGETPRRGKAKPALMRMDEDFLLYINSWQRRRHTDSSPSAQVNHQPSTITGKLLQRPPLSLVCVHRYKEVKCVNTGIITTKKHIDNISAQLFQSVVWGPSVDMTGGGSRASPRDMNDWISLKMSIAA